MSQISRKRLWLEIALVFVAVWIAFPIGAALAAGNIGVLQILLVGPVNIGGIVALSVMAAIFAFMYYAGRSALVRFEGDQGLSFSDLQDGKLYQIDGQPARCVSHDENGAIFLVTMRVRNPIYLYRHVHEHEEE